MGGGLSRTWADILKTKTLMGKTASELAQKKEASKVAFAEAKADKSQEVAFAAAKAEKAKAGFKASKNKLKHVKQMMKKDREGADNLHKTQHEYDKENFKAEGLAAAVAVSRDVLGDVKRGEPADLADAKKAGEVKADAAIEKEEQAKADKAKAAKVVNKKESIDSSTKAFAAIAKDAMKAQAAATPPAPTDTKCQGNEDKHTQLCGIIKNHKHCGFAKYKDYCCGSCNAGGEKSLGDAHEDGIQRLENSLHKSIAEADVAMKHAHKTVVATKDSLSGAN